MPNASAVTVSSTNAASPPNTARIRDRVCCAVGIDIPASSGCRTKT
ncbi:Uncharacterised protein [Mycobacteroides abscessus subsp. abscessus]|nr:Uncharacterised protein [Mycobacteroides abscessus subsp. abscessus]